MEWCAVMAAKKQQNRLLRYFLGIIKEMAPQMIHKCPYPLGPYEFLNVRVPKSVTNFLPIELHRVQFKVVDGDTKNVIFGELEYEVTF